MADKSEQAFRTIGELSDDLGVPQHVLRYWETRFPQLKPMQRAGNRRYYRPADVALARRIHALLNEQGYTIRGVLRVLEDKNAPADAPRAAQAGVAAPTLSREKLLAIRAALASALDDSLA